LPPVLHIKNGDRRREHENEKAPGDTNTRSSRGEAGRYGAAGRDQQPRPEDIETPHQIVGQRVHQSEKDRDRDYAPSTPSSSAATASSIDCSSGSDADRTCEPYESVQCPNDKNPIFFKDASD